MVGVTLCALLGVGVVQRLERAEVVDVDGVVVAIEGHDVDFSWWDRMSIGVGTGGTVGLVADRCVGFVSGRHGVGTADDTVIAWPPGTRVAGTASDLRITAHGVTVRLGEQITGGFEFGHDLSALRKQLPAACRHARLENVDPTG